MAFSSVATNEGFRTLEVNVAAAEYKNMELERRQKQLMDQRAREGKASARITARDMKDMTSIVMTHAMTALFPHLKILTKMSELDFDKPVRKFMFQNLGMNDQFGRDDEEGKRDWWERVEMFVNKGLSERRSNVSGELRKAVKGTYRFCICSSAGLRIVVSLTC